MRKNLKPNVCQKGGLWYYRKRWTAGTKRKEKYIPLPAPDTPEHDRVYWSIRSGQYTAPERRTSWNNLAKSYFAGSRFKRLAPGTQRKYRAYIEAFVEKNGPKDISATRRAHVMAIHEKFADTPRKADWYVQVISILFRHAIELEWATENPAKGVELFGASNPFEPWPDALQQAYIDAAGGAALTAYHLGTGTGQRPGDLCKMKWEHFDGEFMSVRQEKTGKRLWVYCPPKLRDYLATLPRSGDYILAKNLRQPMGYNAMEKAFRAVRNTLKTKQRLTMHGWRYTAAVELAEAGCSDAEIQSVTGHKTLEMVQKYRNQARQKQLSKGAQGKRK